MDSNSWLKSVTGDLTQIHSAACREYILPREDEASQLKGWIQGNTKIEPVLEVATSYFHGNMPARKKCVKKENKKNCVSIGGKRKNTKKIVPMERRNWIVVEPGKYSFSDFEVSKKATFLLRHSQHMHREENGVVHFCSERKSSEPIHTIYSLVRRSMKSILGRRKRREKKIPVMYWCFTNNCLFPSSWRTFKTHSYWSFIAGQCFHSEQLLPRYLPHWMCVQSGFYHQLWINTWRSKFEQKTDSILLACWSYGQKSQGS